MLQDKKIILASASKQRVNMLKEAGLTFTVEVSDVDEEKIYGVTAAETATLRAVAKAEVIARKFPEDIVIAADTVVESNDGALLGKPANKKEAKEMFSALLGTTHQVISVAVLIVGEDSHIFQEKAWVTLRAASASETDDYIATEESIGKAGGLCVQGEGKKFVDNIEGENAAVIGLPLEQILEFLEHLKLIK